MKKKDIRNRKRFTNDDILAEMRELYFYKAKIQAQIDWGELKLRMSEIREAVQKGNEFPSRTL